MNSFIYKKIHLGSLKGSGESLGAMRNYAEILTKCIMETNSSNISLRNLSKILKALFEKNEKSKK